MKLIQNETNNNNIFFVTDKSSNKIGVIRLKEIQIEQRAGESTNTTESTFNSKNNFVLKPIFELINIESE